MVAVEKSLWQNKTASFGGEAVSEREPLQGGFMRHV